jgi:hypothetical protein
MLDKKIVANFRRRINKTKMSFGAMGDMLLCMDLDRLTNEEKVYLRDALTNSRKPLKYFYLDELVQKIENQQMS